MPRRRKEVDVADLDDVDLLERVLDREDLSETERDAFEGMLETQRWRAETFADPYPLTDAQRGWAERVAARPKTRGMTGAEFNEAVRETIGRYVRL
jgi:hypothetical protein